MLKSVRKEPTVKKIVNLSDRLVAEIDEIAIGIYSNRSEFLTEAIRSFTRLRINHDRVMIEGLQDDYDGEELAAVALAKSQNSLKRLKDRSDKYEMEERTPITVYITQYQLDCIYSCFVMPGGAVRNLQDYARIAAVAELRTLRMERDFVENIRMKGSLKHRRLHSIVRPV